MANEIVSHKDRVHNLRGLFEKAKPSIAAVLPKHITAEKILKITLSAASRNPQLLNCTPESILLAVMQSSALGLEPNTPLGHAYLIPYKSGKDNKYECQFIPGYRGLLLLARQSGEITTLRTRIVHKGDEFRVEYGSDEKLHHVPNLGDAQPIDPETGEVVSAALTHVYAVAEFKGGGSLFEVMTRPQIDAIRARSRASGSGPWVTDYEEMARKTVVRRLAKYLPLSPELASALTIQARAERGDGPDYGEMVEIVPQLAEGGASAQPTKPETPTETLKAKLAAKVGEGDSAQGTLAE